MSLDHLLPPLPPIRPAASHGPAPAAIGPVICNRCSRRLTLDSNVRKAPSFFRPVTALVANILRNLRLCRPVLTESEKANVATYKRFKEFEGDIRMGVLAKYEDHLRGDQLSSAEVESFHQKFHLDFNRVLAESFPAILLETREQHSELDFSDALCEAYQSTINNLLADQNVYSTDYANAMKVPTKDILGGLKMTIAPQRTPTSMPTLAGGAGLVAADQTADYLSEKDCDDFADIQFVALQESLEAYERKFKAASHGRVWPENAVFTFKKTFLDTFNAGLPDLSSDQVSREALHTAHEQAMKPAIEAAIRGITNQEIHFSDEDEFKEMLTKVCDDINTEIRKRADPRVTGLPQA